MKTGCHFPLWIKVVMAAAICTVAYGSALGDTGEIKDCAVSTDPIIENVVDKKKRAYPIEQLKISFDEDSVPFELSNGTPYIKEVVLPRISISTNVSNIAQNAVSDIQSKIPDKLSGIDIVRSSVKATDVSVTPRVIYVSGTVRVEKWGKMDGFECKWKGKLIGGYLRCSRTEWKTRLFEKTLKWQASFRLGERVNKPELGSKHQLPTSLNDVHESTTEVVLEGSAKVKKISNDLESFIIDLGGWISAALTEGKFDRWNVTNDLAIGIGGFNESVESREDLYPAEEKFLYSEPSVFYRREGARGFWQVFVDTLYFDSAHSKFTSRQGGGISLQLVYAQDNKRFAKLLASNNDGRGFDPFKKIFFCANPENRVKVERYLENIASQISGGDNEQDKLLFSGDHSALIEMGKQRYGNIDSVNYLLKKGYIERVGQNTYSGSSPSVEELLALPELLLAWDNIDTYSNYFSLSKEERACVTRLTIQRRGSADKVFPFDDFSSCMSKSALTDLQRQILIDVLKKTEEAEITEVKRFVDPVKSPQYRGWYYCYRNTRLCAGKGNIYWWQDPSKFGDRGGRHKGIDLIGDDYLGATSIYAVTGGRLSFSDRDKLGWGNALILPFKSSGIQYLAVYGHLTSAARSWDNKQVGAGDLIGTTGCTGNAGDGKGNCNTYCKWAGDNRTDEHLHLEVIKNVGSGFERVDPEVVLGLEMIDNSNFDKVDPVTLLGLQIKSDNKKFRARCASGQ